MLSNEYKLKLLIILAIWTIYCVPSTCGMLKSKKMRKGSMLMHAFNSMTTGATTLLQTYLMRNDKPKQEGIHIISLGNRAGVQDEWAPSVHIIS